jgi:hypothetical protein
MALAAEPARRGGKGRSPRGRRRLLEWSRPASFARGSRFPAVFVNGAAPVPNVGRRYPGAPP